MWRDVLWVALGGALGSSLRFGAGVLVGRWMPGAYWAGTLAVNLVGSLLIGILFGLSRTPAGVPAASWLFLVTGVLGGFTTFSSFSLDVVRLSDGGHPERAALYALSTFALGVGACLAGYLLVRPSAAP